MTSYFTTEHHDRIRERVRAFAETEICPYVADMEASRTFQRRLPWFMAIQGWMGPPSAGNMGG
jgi:acyl-CoA dehydrogenase